MLPWDSGVKRVLLSQKAQPPASTFYQLTCKCSPDRIPARWCEHEEDAPRLLLPRVELVDDRRPVAAACAGATLRRQLLRARLLSSKTSAATERGVIRIGDVAAPLGDAPKRPSLIPQVTCNTSDPSALGTVQWLMKKAILRQDALLLGNHPAAMRALVTQFANVMEARDRVCVHHQRRRPSRTSSSAGSSPAAPCFSSTSLSSKLR